MINEIFALYIKQNIAAGQQQIAGMTRSVMEQIDPALASQVEINDEEAFLEPLLFAFICERDVAIDPVQILLGYINPQEKPTEIDVITDCNGLVYLPRIGYFATDVPDRLLRMEWNASSNQYELFDGIQPIVCRFEELRTVADKCVEVLRGKHPLLNRYFVDPDGKPTSFRTDDNSGHQITNLAKAFEIIRQVHPVYYECIRSVTQDVVIFHSEPMNSFATLSVHGAAFLNTSDRDDEVFFIEDLAHQCGHIVFNALTFETENYLLVPRDTPLRNFNEREEETRSVYDAFHGLFTEAMMYECLHECYIQNIFEGRQHQELIGRMAFILSRFALDLNLLARHPLFTDNGLLLLGNIMKIFKAGYEVHWQNIVKLNFSNQGYNFSYDRFVEANGTVLI